MYEFLKKILFAVFSKGFISRNETFLRNINYQLIYKGNSHKCNVCDINLKKFIPHSYGNLCPKCGSLPRTRFLWALLSNEEFPEKKLLHFSPQKGLQKKLQSILSNNYYDTDYQSKTTKFSFDIQQINLEDNAIDIIICYHVLEHVPNDIKAMKELHRIINPNGYICLQVPFREGETIEDPTEKDPKVRLAKFGQEDHLRWYNLDDFTHRLQSVGFKTELIKTKDSGLDLNYLGLNQNEVVIKAYKVL